ncbi:archaeosortase A [Halobacteria archaeon AArc-m2/3/4]|uniref:Archaeosortase A n=1 Tax=Natronoglomus mannanivorans TaxID=2979990 RepID=A0AAP2YY28_9EURY|nr:archaeosortase A [Halobacteria archaeon AArc-xg1-1]MCU4973365.1 archaeosortase A [Halobacteria archaeon AArc-m2/3/4]
MSSLSASTAPPSVSSSALEGTSEAFEAATVTVPLSLPDFYTLAVSDVMGWIVIGTFLLAMALQWRGVTDGATYLAAGGWALFGVFWLWVAPHFFYEAQSPLQTILSIAALPLCLYTGYLLVRGRTSLLVLSNAVAFMGLIYLPAETVPVFRTWLIETTAAQTHFGMELLGSSPGLNEGSNGYLSRFDFDPDETATGRTTYIVLACTGIGSMSIFGGLIAAVAAPLRRKLAAFALAVGIIWILNLFRNVFVGLATPHGWFQYDPLIYVTTEWMGSVPERTSFLVAHNFIAQTLSIFALIGITYLVIKVLPEVLEPLEEALFVLTGTEYDLAEAVGAQPVSDGDSQPVRADGEGTDVGSDQPADRP